MDIDKFLQEQEKKSILRFLTCGSVDDGKSTLIGRILYDSKKIFNDQLLQLESESKKYGTTNSKIDLALLVDGLQSEREQGITIDVAYRFFTSNKKKYIIADTPGHEQYTRNMVTGASNSDVAVILIDASKGILQQTKRHSFLVALLGIKNIIIAINKMDLVNYSETIYDNIIENYYKVFEKLKTALPHKHYEANIKFIPLSALNRDNIVRKSTNMPWYKEQTLLDTLDSIELPLNKEKEKNFRFPVQYINRPHSNFRGYCGTVLSGSIEVGERITVLSSGKSTKVKSIINAGDIRKKDKHITTNRAIPSMAITITTTDEIDISRGDMIVKTSQIPRVSNSLKVMIVWMDEEPLSFDKTYYIKHTTTLMSAHIEHINYKIDINSYKRETANSLKLNDIASCKIVLSRAIAIDRYDENKLTGNFIIIDKISNKTVAAGMVIDVAKRESDKVKIKKKEYTSAEIALNKYIREHYPEWGCKSI